jgi:hypothetical protein
LSASDSARRKASWPLDLAVEFDERHVEALRQQGAECGLAATAQADQRDAAAVATGRGKMLADEGAGFGQPVRRQPFEKLRQQHQIERRFGAVMHKLRQRQAERARDPPQQHDRNIAEARLQLRKIALRHFRVLRQQLARRAALMAQHPDALAERAQVADRVAVLVYLRARLALRGLAGG